MVNSPDIWETHLQHLASIGRVAAGVGGIEIESQMVRESDAAYRMAVEFVTVMMDVQATDLPTEHPGSGRVQAMVNDAVSSGEMTDYDLLGALGLLSARAIEDLARATGEPGAFWLRRWLAEPFG